MSDLTRRVVAELRENDRIAFGAHVYRVTGTPVRISTRTSLVSTRDRDGKPATFRLPTDELVVLS